MYREFLFDDEKYIINISNIDYINYYKDGDGDYHLDIYMKYCSYGSCIRLFDNENVDIYKLYCDLKSWLI